MGDWAGAESFFFALVSTLLVGPGGGEWLSLKEGGDGRKE